MAQLIVRDLEDDVRDRLRALAAKHGRSMEEEVREILRKAVLGTAGQHESNLGSHLMEHFRGFDLDAGEIEELRGQAPQPDQEA
jgi:plasmid stability protein